jgi:hypothetical protein
MKLKHSLALALLSLVSVSSTAGQSKSNIETKYGPPIKAYSVSENIWMTPEFTRDGRLCMARLYSKQIDATTNYIQGRLWLWEVKDVFDQLAPVATRGKKIGDLGLSVIGNTVFEGLIYERVRINFVSGLKGYEPSENDEPEFRGMNRPQIVTITWTDRTCKP